MDYYYNYDPQMNLDFNDNIYYGQFASAQHGDQNGRAVEESVPEQPAPEAHNPKPAHKVYNHRPKPKVMPRPKKQEAVPTMSGVSLLCLIVLFVVFFTIWRYGLLGYAIEKGNTIASLALLSPEIGNAIYLAAL